MVKLGSRVRDTITGLEGIATGRYEYLYGCVRIVITPTTLKEDGSVQDDFVFDEQRVEVLQKDEPKVSPDSSATSGGPMRDLHRQSRVPARG